MSQPNSSLRDVPAVGTLVNEPAFRTLVERHGQELVTWAVREELGAVREAVAKGKTVPAIERIAGATAHRIREIVEPSLKRVINATGVVLHTNMGRAPLGREVLDDIAPIVEGYSNLEFDLSTGERGRRLAHIAPLLRFLTGAEDALVVNNNAAAIILILHQFARGKEVIISRGELIEIGGSFRIPDIMRASGARMVEVGTTNKTRLGDFETAFSPKTALIMKAHKSNYSIHGFTEEPSLADLARVAHERGVPFVYDIGSGLLRMPAAARATGEPDVRSALGEGVDLVTFSGDKLIGGPQAGVIAGKAELVARLAKAPLMRALRVGKVTLAALGSACRRYLRDDTLVSGNPAFAILEQAVDTISRRAERLHERLAANGITTRIVESVGKSGGGALPDLDIPSRAVLIEPPAGSRTNYAERLYRRLMTLDNPVIGVMSEGRLQIDMLTVRDDEIETVVSALTEATSA